MLICTVSASSTLKKKKKKLTILPSTCDNKRRNNIFCILSTSHTGDKIPWQGSSLFYLLQGHDLGGACC